MLSFMNNTVKMQKASVDYFLNASLECSDTGRMMNIFIT